MADDSEEGFTTDDDWNPQLFPYQQEAANVSEFFKYYQCTANILSIKIQILPACFSGFNAISFHCNLITVLKLKKLEIQYFLKRRRNKVWLL